MQDYFGYDRKVKVNDQIVSSEFFVLTVGAKIALLQSVNMQYQRDIQPVYCVGDTTIYFTHGHSSGTLQASRLVGKEGVLKAFQSADCGKISSLNVSIEGSGQCAVSGSGSVHFDGGQLQSVGFSAQAGQLQISETANILFGTLMV